MKKKVFSFFYFHFNKFKCARWDNRYISTYVHAHSHLSQSVCVFIDNKKYIKKNMLTIKNIKKKNIIISPDNNNNNKSLEKRQSKKESSRNIHEHICEWYWFLCEYICFSRVMLFFWHWILIEILELKNTKRYLLSILDKWIDF
jgi:hypothetical protein